jgi:hypothetical protein
MAKPRNKIGIERDSLHQAPGISVPRPVEAPVESKNANERSLRQRARVTHGESRKRGK